MNNALPGLDYAELPTGKLLAAVEATITHKEKAGLLTPEHAALCELARSLAIAIDAGAALGKTSVPQAAQQLLNTLERLPAEIVENTEDQLAAAMRKGMSE